MSIQTIHDTGSSYNITSKMDGGVYQVATQDCVVGGIGDEFTMQYTGSSLNATFLAGSEAVIGGSFFKITGDTTIELPASSQIYVCATIDLTKPNGQRGLFTTRTSANMQHGNINGSDNVRDMLLYIVTTNASGVSNVVDNRKIITSGANPYPVGSIYMSVVNTNPSTLFGGTWEQLKDKFLLGAGDIYNAGTTGGEAEHTLTINEMPSHTHSYNTYSYTTHEGSASTGVLAGATSGTTGSSGGGQAHNNMPPYLTVYIWKRIA